MTLRLEPLKVAGVLYVVAAFQFFVFELVAEALYSGYSVASNYISDLGATCLNPPSTARCVVHQPSATIFDTTVFVLGLLLLAGALLVSCARCKTSILARVLFPEVARGALGPPLLPAGPRFKTPAGPYGMSVRAL